MSDLHDRTLAFSDAGPCTGESLGLSKTHNLCYA